MIDKKDNQFLATNVKGLMMTLIARWNGRMDGEQMKTEFAGIRPSDMRVFGNMRGRSMRLSAIHREMGFSRQAAQQAVSRLVGHDMVRIEPLADNRRDKMVVITEKGHRWRTEAARQIRDIEAACAAVIGADGVEALRDLLLRLIEEEGPA